MEKLRHQRSETDVGRRGGGHPARRPRQSPPIDAHAGTQRSIASLREDLLGAHRERFGPNADSDLYLGLQITHSGRFARPDVWDIRRRLRPAIIRFSTNVFPMASGCCTDADLDRLIDDYIAAAKLASDCGYQFVDAKACHGYLGHELLGATTRGGKYGGLAGEPAALHHPDDPWNPCRRARPGLSSSGCRFSMLRRTARTAERRRAGGDDGEGAGVRSAQRGRDGPGARGRPRAVETSRGARRELDLHYCGQSVLQPSHTTSCVLSSSMATSRPKIRFAASPVR